MWWWLGFESASNDLKRLVNRLPMKVRTVRATLLNKGTCRIARKYSCCYVNGV